MHRLKSSSVSLPRLSSTSADAGSESHAVRIRTELSLIIFIGDTIVFVVLRVLDEEVEVVVEVDEVVVVQDVVVGHGATVAAALEVAVAQGGVAVEVGAPVREEENDKVLFQ